MKERKGSNILDMVDVRTLTLGEVEKRLGERGLWGSDLARTEVRNTILLGRLGPGIWRWAREQKDEGVLVHWLVRRGTGVEAYGPIACAASYGDLESMEALRGRRCPADAAAMAYAAGAGQLAAMERLHEWKCPMSGRAMTWAAREGQLVAMERLHEWGYHRCIDGGAMTEAAQAGQLAIMEKLHEWKAPMDKWAMVCAARAGQLAAMEKLREWGASIYIRAMTEAAGEGQLAAMERLREWNAPVDVRAMRMAATAEVRAWLREKYPELGS